MSFPVSHVYHNTTAYFRWWCWTDCFFCLSSSCENLVEILESKKVWHWEASRSRIINKFKKTSTHSTTSARTHSNKSNVYTRVIHIAIHRKRQHYTHNHSFTQRYFSLMTIFLAVESPACERQGREFHLRTVHIATRPLCADGAATTRCRPRWRRAGVKSHSFLYDFFCARMVCIMTYFWVLGSAWYDYI